MTVEVPGEETAGHRDGSDHGGCCAAFCAYVHFYLLLISSYFLKTIST